MMNLHGKYPSQFLTFGALAICLVMILNSCNESGHKSEAENDVSTNRTEHKDMGIEATDTSTSLDSNMDLDTDLIDEYNQEKKDLSGKHGLTLQWIGWEPRGVVDFKPIGN